MSNPTKTFHSHVLSQQHIQNIHNYVMKNESHDNDDDDDVQEMDNSKHDQTYSNALTEHDMMPRDGNFPYTNCHPQKSLMIGDMHWID
jgi:hypothetical protein